MRKRGLTLIELLVCLMVIALIGLGVAAAFPGCNQQETFVGTVDGVENWDDGEGTHTRYLTITNRQGVTRNFIDNSPDKPEADKIYAFRTQGNYVVDAIPIE